VEEIRKTSLLLKIRDDAIHALLGLTHQGNLSYAEHTNVVNDILRKSARQPLTYDLHGFICASGHASFFLQTHAKSYHSQMTGYILPLVELQNFLNDLVIDSPNLGRARPTTTWSTTPRGGQLTRE
jgi:hypothetical protein